MEGKSFKGVMQEPKKTPASEETDVVTDANCKACKGTGKVKLLGSIEPVACPLCVNPEKETS